MSAIRKQSRAATKIHDVGIPLIAMVLSICAAVARGESLGLPPLNTLGEKKYQGFVGGLYPDGMNEPWGAHAEALKRVCRSIIPLDREGRPSADGKIVVAGIGASVCRQVFAALEEISSPTAGMNPAVVFVNCARGGQDVGKIADPSGRYWAAVLAELEACDLSPAQVQVAWYQSDDLRDPGDDFPGRPQRLKNSIAGNMRLLKQHLPNVKICYHSARHTTAFLGENVAKEKHGEPRPYHVGWAVKWLIEDQAAGRADLHFEGTDAVAPLCAWATYFWTDGDQTRHDGYRWTREDVVKDGVHLSPAARPRVALELLQFFAKDHDAKAWFAANPMPPAKAPSGSAATDESKPSRARASTSSSPAWIINGNDKMPKLRRLVGDDNVRVVVRTLDGKQVAEIPDVLNRHTDLNQLVGAGEFRIEFLDSNNKPIRLTQQVGEVVRLK